MSVNESKELRELNELILQLNKPLVAVIEELIGEPIQTYVKGDYLQFLVKSREGNLLKIEGKGRSITSIDMISIEREDENSIDINVKEVK